MDSVTLSEALNLAVAFFGIGLAMGHMLASRTR
ncbi:hypothetical protein C8N24_0326 [Solirubrobacter pauli]|uniref:Uncharacterized protein n=1 Tax=Solirubrobacter pauli TaxID=166793 RepID=A0A660LCV4_9ACTN|nr:hypothetical protein C8N24_0326 [Solirubrobacter pauli]